MIYEIVLSLRLHLANNIPEATDVEILRDGKMLSGTAKPFLTVEQMPGIESAVSAGHASYSETYNFQIGVFTESIGQRMKLEGKVRDLLKSPEGVPLYNEDGTVTSETFLCDVGAFTPLQNDDAENETFNYRGYFDVSVSILRNHGESTFSQ